MTLLRVLLVAPEFRGAPTGNEISVRRLERGLRARGHAVFVVRPGAVGLRPEVDLVHAFHARRTGPVARELAERLGVPLVVTLTGTDVERDLHDPSRAPVVGDVLNAASAIVCGHTGARDRAAAVTGRRDHLFVTPKGVVVPDALPPPAFPRDPGRVVVLQVAHLRPVKNNLLAVNVVGRLQRAGLPVVLRLLGDALDRAYGMRLEEAAGGPAAWAEMWHAAVPHAEVGRWYAAADVVLNTSDGEGGSNALLEAMSHGVTVLASAIPGNLAYVGSDGSRGWTYPARELPDGRVEHDAAALALRLRELVGDAELRARLGAAGRHWVREEHGDERELAGVLAAYERAREAPSAS